MNGLVQCSKNPLLNHLVGALLKEPRYVEAEPPSINFCTADAVSRLMCAKRDHNGDRDLSKAL
jgi:hypothetical protein